MTFLKTATSAAALAIFASASAADTARIAAGLSIFGPTVEAQIPITDKVTLRGSIAGGLSASGTTTADGLDYTMNANLGATTLMATYHLPVGMRVSGGFLLSNTSLSGSVTGSAGDTVGGVVVPSAFSISSNAEFANSFAPMATVGFDIPVFGMVLSTDAGLVNTGGFDVTLTETTATPIIPSGDLTTAEATIESELSGYDYIPYVSLMVGKWF